MRRISGGAQPYNYYFSSNSNSSQLQQSPAESSLSSRTSTVASVAPQTSIPRNDQLFDRMMTNIQNGNAKAFRDILKNQGARALNAKDVAGNTVLHACMYTGNVTHASLLLNSGADPDLPDNSGWTPRMIVDYNLQQEPTNRTYLGLKQVLDMPR